MPSKTEENNETIALNTANSAPEIAVEYRFDERLGKIVPINKPSVSKIEEKSQNSLPLASLLKVPEIDIEPQVERISKYLSRSSITSRRGAKKMLESGVVQVNDKKVLADVKIDPLVDKVSIFTKEGY